LQDEPLLTVAQKEFDVLGIAVQMSPIATQRSRDNGSMRKHLLDSATVDEPKDPSPAWLAVDRLATVEISSEDAAYPIESVFQVNGRAGSGWRAAAPGKQLIRLLFDSPQPLRSIWLRFGESQVERTQEFTLRYAEQGRVADREIVRQQWSFSPSGSTSETEKYQVDLPKVSVLELALDPDQGRGEAVASLAEWRLA
jgi:hypothetical protein